MCWNADRLFGKPYNLRVTCVPASASALRSSWMQLRSSSDAHLRPAVKGCSFCGWNTEQVSGARLGGQPAREEEEDEQCQARAGNIAGHQVKAEEAGSGEVDGQLQAGAVELSFSFPSPGLSCHFSGDVHETRKPWWGWRGTVGR